MMRSQKPIKPLAGLIGPFTIKPEKDIYGGVNGKPFFFPKNVETVMDYPQYGAVFYSEFKGEL